MNNALQTAAVQKLAAQDFIDAMHRGDMNKMKDLLAHGLDPDSVAPHGDIPVLATIMRGQPAQKVDIIKLLIAHGADMEIRRQGYEWTPLMQAANNREVAIVSLLIAQGVDLDKKDKDGKTALDIAEEHDNPDVADILKSAFAVRAAREQARIAQQAREQARIAEQDRHKSVLARQQYLQKQAKRRPKLKFRP